MEVSGLHRSINKDIVAKSISRMKNGKALEPSRLVEEIAKSASEIRINIKDLIKGITIEGRILAE